MLVSTIALADENYCLDSVINEKWESIAKRNASNQDVVCLYILRGALCAQIEKGFIDVPEATDIFEAERERVIKRLPHPRT